MTSAMTPAATLVFTTHNRHEQLRQALLAAQKQTVPVRILVMDDASTDDTPRLMAEEFPHLDYHRSEQNLGPCYHRNRGIALAETSIVFPLDDDSVLQSPHTVAQTLAEFDHSWVGAVAIPFINILQDQTIWTQAPDTHSIYLTHAFVAAAHAVRRDAFLQTGGYREFFFYMGEEGDLAIRLLNHRYGVRLGAADPIHHYQPVGRISRRADMFGRQNDVLFVYCNVPFPYWPIYLAGTSLKGLMYGVRVRRLGVMVQGLIQGFKLTFQVEKSPVTNECFQLYRRLKQKQRVPFTEVASYFE